MSEHKIKYSGDAAIAVTQWGTSLLAGEKATSAIFDNTTARYIDLLVGGIIELSATTPVANDSLDIYIGALYDKDVTSTPGGGIDSLMDPGTPAEEVEDTDFVLANLILFKSLQIELLTPATAQGYQFNPQGCAQFFGGIMPQKIYFLLHNNTGAALAAGSALNSVGITYETL
jgi:hypothetical protein